GLGHAERAGTGVGAQRLRERGGRGELVGAARAPASVHSVSTAHNGGLHALPISGTQDRTASQPIILIRADGAAILLIRKAPITMPRGTAAISSPTVSALPCRERVYGAASPRARCRSRPASRTAAGSAAGGCRTRSGRRPP